jgi:hypothetical protein
MLAPPPNREPLPRRPGGVGRALLLALLTALAIVVTLALAVGVGIIFSPK